MSPRTLIALASVIVIGAACARASNSAPEADDAGGSDGNTTDGPATSNNSSNSTTTSGNGGAGNTSMSTGGSEGGAGGESTTSGGGGNTNTCTHDTCTEGIALVMGCGDSCVDTVCTDDSYCCDGLDGEWDSTCVGEAVSMCGAACMLPPAYGDLVISEIMNNPASVADNVGEWFEVYNATLAPIDLMGLAIRHQDPLQDPSAVETIGSSVVVPADGYVVLGINSNASTNGGVSVTYTYSATVNLANDDDYLAIEDASQNIIDEVYYSQTSGLDPNGKSRNLNPLFLNGYDNDDDTFFCEATTAMSGTDFGTPGTANDACPP